MITKQWAALAVVAGLMAGSMAFAAPHVQLIDETLSGAPSMSNNGTDDSAASSSDSDSQSMSGDASTSGNGTMSGTPSDSPADSMDSSGSGTGSPDTATGDDDY